MTTKHHPKNRNPESNAQTKAPKTPSAVPEAAPPTVTTREDPYYFRVWHDRDMCVAAWCVGYMWHYRTCVRLLEPFPNPVVVRDERIDAYRTDASVHAEISRTLQDLLTEAGRPYEEVRFTEISGRTEKMLSTLSGNIDLCTAVLDPPHLPFVHSGEMSVVMAEMGPLLRGEATLAGWLAQSAAVPVQTRSMLAIHCPLNVTDGSSPVRDKSNRS